MDRSNFGNLRKHEDFKEQMEKHDIGLAWGARYAVGFERLDDEPDAPRNFEDYFPPENEAEPSSPGDDQEQAAGKTTVASGNAGADHEVRGPAALHEARQRLRG